MRSAGDRRTHPAARTMLAQRLIAIIRTSSPALAITAGRALFAAGLGAVEVALTTPGALTPTEMVHAHQAGADLIKVFPATAWTPPALKDVLAPLPHLLLVPTGGVRI